MRYEAKLAKKELSALRHMLERYMDMKERAIRLQEMAQKATSSIRACNVSGTGEKSKIEQNIDAKIDLERTMQDVMNEIWRKKKDMITVISSMRDEREKRILELRYIDGHDWIYIMDCLHLSRAQSFRLHESALEHWWQSFCDFRKVETK